ncbi:MAG: hypothetical protein ACRC67_26140 [Inquilinus sp.]|uniref:hypothetical protein n=1 Tax=Inquilinus sp. TaxID=1932117 RepID=UPI003F2B9CD3
MRGGWVRDAVMENHPWQLRARAAGLTQRLLAKILNHHERTVSIQLRSHGQRGVPGHVIAAIVAWEVMTPEQRESWLAKLETEFADNQRSEQSKPTVITAAELRALQQYVRDLEQRLEKAETQK